MVIYLVLFREKNFMDDSQKMRIKIFTNEWSRLVMASNREKNSSHSRFFVLFFRDLRNKGEKERDGGRRYGNAYTGERDRAI